MTKFIDTLKKKINDKFYPDKLQIIDNSYLHTKHKSFDPEKLHLKIIINSTKIQKMEKIKTHKEIFSLLKDEMKDKIHALEIEIK